MIDIKETRVPKTKSVQVLQGNYGYGWDDLCYYEDNPEGWKEQRADIKAYRENERGVPFRIITRKEPNPDYKAPEDRFRVYPAKVASYTGRLNKTGETKKFTDLEDAIEYAKSLNTLCVLKDIVTGITSELDGNNKDDYMYRKQIDDFRDYINKTANEGFIKEKRFSHIKKLKEEKFTEDFDDYDDDFDYEYYEDTLFDVAIDIGVELENKYDCNIECISVVPYNNYKEAQFNYDVDGASVSVDVKLNPPYDPLTQYDEFLDIVEDRLRYWI